MDRIYILKSDNYYKIGVAADVDRRVKGLQTGNPHTIECIFSRLVPEAYTVEKHIHKELEVYKVKGEWFKFDDRVLDYIKDMIIFNMRLCQILIDDRKRLEDNMWGWCLYRDDNE